MVYKKTQNTVQHTNLMKNSNKGSQQDLSKGQVFVINQTQVSMSVNRRTWVFNLLKIFYDDKNIMASKNHRNILNQQEIIPLVYIS